MEKEICCLRKVGPATEKVADKDLIIGLDNKNELNIGRAEDSTVCIPDRMISRKHAILQKSDGVWTVTDNKSLNGCYINDEKIEPTKPHTLEDGDLLRLGLSPGENQPPLFVFEFKTHLKVRLRNIPRNSIRKRKRNLVNDDAVPPEKRASPCKVSPRKTEALWSPSAALERKLKEQEEQAQAAVREKEDELREMQEKLREKDLMQEQYEQELRNKEEAMRKELADQQEKLEKQRQEFEDKMKAVLEDELRQKEESLKEQMSNQMGELQQEKQRIEESLQQEMTRKLEEKDQYLEQELLQQKENLETIIATKEANQKLLESQLNDTKSENAKQKESMLRAREDVLANFEDILETELQCSICNELFVKATSLNCSHSFCEVCIKTWMKRKKECPNCRQKIKSTIHSIVLDNYIDTMVCKLSEEIQTRRKELVESRTGKKSKPATSAAKPTTSGIPNINIVMVAGTPVVRVIPQNSTNNNGVLTAGTPIVIPDNPIIINDNNPVVISDDNVANEVVIINDDDEEEDDEHDEDEDSDDSVGSHFSYDRRERRWRSRGYDSDYRGSDDSDNDEEEDDDYEPGLPGAYFGGYGHCFRCGSRGHWANGCPNR